MNRQRNAACGVRNVMAFWVGLGVVMFTALRTPHSACAADTITTATLTFTNGAAGTTNGQTATIYWNSTNGIVYTWSNTVAGFHRLAATNSATKSATNWFNKMRADWTNKLIFSYSSPTTIVMRTYLNSSLTMGISSNWGTISLVTNAPSNNAGVTMSNVVATSITLGGDTRTSWPSAGTGIASNSGAGILNRFTNATVVGLNLAGTPAGVDSAIITNLSNRRAFMIQNDNNDIDNTSFYSSILGGNANFFGQDGNYSTIVGGLANTNNGSLYNFIGGGAVNLIQGAATAAAIVGGENNSIFKAGSGASDDAFIGAGSGNSISNSAYAVIAGGRGNLIRSAPDAVAIGRSGYVTNAGTIVIADGQAAAFNSINTNTVILRAQNGVGVNTNNPGTNSLAVHGSSYFAGNVNITGAATIGGTTAVSVVTATSFNGNGGGLTNLQAPLRVNSGSTTSLIYDDLNTSSVLDYNGGSGAATFNASTVTGSFVGNSQNPYDFVGAHSGNAAGLTNIPAAQITGTFTSTNITISAANVVTIGHSLGTTPRLVRGVLRCTANDGNTGLVIGDEIPLEVVQDLSAGSVSSVYANSSNVVYVTRAITTGNEANVQIVKKDGSALAAPSSFGNFKVKIYAYP